MATHSNTLAMENPTIAGGLYSPWGHKESDMTEQLHFPSFLLWVLLKCYLLREALLHSSAQDGYFVTCSNSIWHPSTRFPGEAVVKNPPANAGDAGLIPGLGRSPGEGNGNPLQYYCLEKSHGQRSLVGYIPWGCKKSDMTEQQTLTQICTHICVYGTCIIYCKFLSPSGSGVENLPANAGDVGLIPGMGRSPGEGNGYPL